MRYPSLRQGLVGAWCPSLGPSGNTLLDRSGYGRHAALTNMDAAVSWSARCSGWMLNFDGANDYLLVPAITLPMPFTLSGRLLTTSASTLIVFEGGANQAQVFVSSGIISMGASFNPGAQVNGVSVNSGLINSFSAVFASTTDRRIYVNGVLAGSGTSSASITLSISQFFSRNGSSLFYNGLADDLRIYSRQLTPNEIYLLASETAIGLKPERTSVFFGSDVFSAAWLSKQSSMIGGGIA